MTLLWNSDAEVMLLSYSNYHIDVKVRGTVKFRLTLFYGNPRVDKRKDSWSLLKTLEKAYGGPRVVLGDFNKILHSWKMDEARNREKNQMKGFREALKSINLIDIGCSRDIFTFSNRRLGRYETKVRLDKVVANHQWRTMFPKASVVHGFANTSDHKHILLFLSERAKFNTARKKFRFESMWLRDKSFNQVVFEAWNGARNVKSGLKDKLKFCSDSIMSWNNKFGIVRKKNKNPQGRIDCYKNSHRSGEIATKEKEMSERLDEWLAREELLWNAEITSSLVKRW